MKVAALRPPNTGKGGNTVILHHISLCTTNIERIVEFYKRYFGGVEYNSYHNEKTGLRICFLKFDKGAMLEVMTRPGFVIKPPERGMGYVHIAMDAGDAGGVDFLTGRLADDGHTVVSEPRQTGGGYYSSTVMDPDGNWIEIMAGG